MYVWCIYIALQFGLTVSNLRSKQGRNKKSRKDSQLVLRVNGEERDAFISLCEALDTSAAREIRRFMRDFVARHSPAQEAEQNQH
ncbi:hypothetical protein LY04_03453 [Oceanimonas baumannii]|uniref:Uncharacterized protein n=1 Tax=Oceanimonas baumannii TaxID=129578 RepID=A0ABY2EUL7_9GAMM|nr:hypothetical protein LY04_03453 [Oceanimonas baumannii]